MPAFGGKQIPSRERKRVEVVYCWTGNNTPQLFPFGQSDCSRFGLTIYDEITCVSEKLGQVGCGSPEEANVHSTLAGCNSPFPFMSIIDERSEYQSQVAFDGRVVMRDDHPVSSGRKNCG
jgi:hypothetical protein